MIKLFKLPLLCVLLSMGVRVRKNEAAEDFLYKKLRFFLTVLWNWQGI